MLKRSSPSKVRITMAHKVNCIFSWAKSIGWKFGTYVVTLANIELTFKSTHSVAVLNIYPKNSRYVSHVGLKYQDFYNYFRQSGYFGKSLTLL